MIKTDLAEQREQHTTLQFESGYSGIRLSKNYMTTIQSIYSVILNQSLFYQLLEELFFNESISIEELG